MTDLERIVVRRALVPHRRRRYIVMLMPGDVLGFREQHRRKVFTAPLATIFDEVVKLNVAAEQRAKRAARAQRR